MKCIWLYCVYSLYQWDVQLGNRMFAYPDDPPTWLLLWSLLTDLWIGIWCGVIGTCCWTPAKPPALVVSRSRIVDLPRGKLVLLGVPIQPSPNLDILGVRCSCIHGVHVTARSPLRFMYAALNSVSQRIGILRLVRCIFDDTPVLLNILHILVFLLCYYAFVFPILECCSPVCGSASDCYLRLLERKVRSVARLVLIRFLHLWTINVERLGCVCCTTVHGLLLLDALFVWSDTLCISSS